MSGSISFNEISYDLRVPQNTFEVRPNYTNTGVMAWPAKLLLVGQMLAGVGGGSGNANQVYPIYRSDQGPGLFGKGSMLAEMVAACRAANPLTPLYAIGAADAGGATAATATVTMNGTAVYLATTIPFVVASRYVGLIVRPTDTLATQAANLVAVINADPLMAVTASSAAAAVTLTAKHKGEAGNGLAVRVGLRGDEEIPAGFSCTVTAFAGGTGNPDITPLLSTVATQWYTDIAVGWTDSANLAVLTPELDRRYSASGKLDAHAYVGYRATLGQALTLGPASNSRFLTRIPLSGAASSPWQVAASLAGIAAQALSDDPARQLRTLALPGILGPAPANRYLMTDQEQLLRNGFGTLDVLSDGTVTAQRITTSYQTSALGVADTAWLDIMTPKVMSRIRYDWASYVALNYPRAKLADDDSPAAKFAANVVTGKILKGTWAARSALYERNNGWIEGAAATAGASTFLRDGADRNRLNSNQQVRIIGNLMILTGALEFAA